MATYLFCCPNHTTDFEFERVQSMKDPNPPCPLCQHETKRLIAGAPATRLLGDGWSQSNYHTTDTGDQARADRADRKGRIVSFPNQKVKS